LLQHGLKNIFNIGENTAWLLAGRWQYDGTEAGIAVENSWNNIM
jgi:hypothetical protein